MEVELELFCDKEEKSVNRPFSPLFDFSYFVSTLFTFRSEFHYMILFATGSPSHLVHSLKECLSGLSSNV